MGHNTGNELPSNDILDFEDNTENLDRLMNVEEDFWEDRFGNKRPTIDYALRMAGFTPAGFDFTTGGVLQPGDRNKCVFNQTDQTWYSYTGNLPYNVIAGSSPNGDWKIVNRNGLVVAREALRRTYQEVGLNLVPGSFESGGTLVSASDVLLQESSGKGYVWNGVFPRYVLPGSDLTGYVDVSHKTHSMFISERSLLEFIPRQYWSGVLDGTNTSDMSVYIQAAIDSGEVIKQHRPLILRMDTPVFFFGGKPYDFGGSILKPTDAFGVLQHKVFTSNEGAGSGQHFSLRNIRIEGDPTKKYEKAGAGLRFNKDLTLNGFAVYDSTIENIVVKDMYYCFDDKGQSGAWMTTFKHLKGINCPVGFAKSIGTTIVLQNVYMLGGHRGFELDNIYGMDMIACAHDGSTDYANDFIESRIEITNSEINIHAIRAEYLSAKRKFINVSNSKVNIGTISLAHYSVDASTSDVDFITAGNKSNVNISNINIGSGTVIGENTVTTIATTAGSTVTVPADVPYTPNGNSLAISSYNSRVYGSRSPINKIKVLEGYVEQTQEVKLFINAVSGNDTKSGLTANEAKQTLSAVIREINSKYVDHTVTIVISGEVSIVGSNFVNCKKLTIKRNITGTIVVVVSAGVGGKLYGPAEIIVDMTTLTFNGTPGSFVNGIVFPSAIQDLDYSLNTIQIKVDSVSLPNNSALTGCVLYGYNGMMSVGIRDSSITGTGLTSSYLCYLSSACAQITTGGGNLSMASVTNGSQVGTSKLYFG